MQFQVFVAHRLRNRRHFIMVFASSDHLKYDTRSTKYIIVYFLTSVPLIASRLRRCDLDNVRYILIPLKKILNIALVEKSSF
jgi:hypothetical protein